MKLRPLLLAVCLTACLAVLPNLSQMATADPSPEPPSWAAFEPASFFDIYLTPSLATGILDYALALGSYPKITLGADTYDVKWVQAYFVVSQDEETDFIATNGTTVTDWRWESKALPGRISGWMGEGTNRVYPESEKPLQSEKALGFGSFDITGNAVLSGLMVGYQAGASEETGWYKDSLPPIPEPSSLLALACGVGGLAGLLRRRRS